MVRVLLKDVVVKKSKKTVGSAWFLQFDVSVVQEDFTINKDNDLLDFLRPLETLKAAIAANEQMLRMAPQHTSYMTRLRKMNEQMLRTAPEHTSYMTRIRKMNEQMLRTAPEHTSYMSRIREMNEQMLRTAPQHTSYMSRIREMNEQMLRTAPQNVSDFSRIQTHMRQALQQTQYLAKNKATWLEQLQATSRMLNTLEKSGLGSTLAKISSSPLSMEIIDHALNTSKIFADENTATATAPDEFLEFQAELSSSGQTDFSLLSEKSKTVFIWLINAIIIQFLVSLAAAETHRRIVNNLENVDTPLEVKRLVHCGDAQAKEMFSGCRVSMQDNLRLLATPSQKGNVIKELPIGKVLVVLDSSKRSWLLVQVETEGEMLEGWVLRRYTTPFR